MRKFYTLALAALCALGASAAERQFASGKNLKVAEVVTETKDCTLRSSLVKAPAKAPAIADLENLGVWTYYGLLKGNTGKQTGTVQITVDDATTGDVTLMISGGINLAATYDATKGTLTIDRQYLGADDVGDIYFYIKDLDSDGRTIDGESETVKAAVATFDGETAEFVATEIWAIGDPENESLGWYVLSAENAFSVPEPEPELIDLGTAKFTENLIYPTFNEGTENKAVTEHSIKTNGEGIYYVYNPLKTFYTQNGWDDESPTLVIDATDPDNVLVPITSTGFGSSSNAYVYYSKSYYSKITGEELDEAFIITKTVDGDNVTITFPYHSTTIWLYNTQNYYYGSIYACTLTFTESASGVDNVAVDNENAPIEYYNLQGVRVNNPSKGQLVIKKQGTTVNKLIVR